MVSKESLRTTALEMVNVLGLVDDDKDPLEVPKSSTIPQLLAVIEEAIPLIGPKDKFTKETQAVINEFKSGKVKEEEEEEEAPKKGLKKPVVAVIPEDDDEEEEVKPAKKPAKKVVAEEEEEEEEKPVKKPAKEEKPAKPVKKEKVEKAPSPYGTSVEVMCSNPDMSFEKLVKELSKKGIDTVSGKSAVNTGYGVVRKVVSLLRKNGLME